MKRASAAHSQQCYCNVISTFLPHDVKLARYMPWSHVPLSVTSPCSTKTAKYRIMQTMLHDSLEILVFCCQKTFAKFECRHPQQERQMQVG